MFTLAEKQVLSLCVVTAVLIMIIVWQMGTIKQLKQKLEIEKTLNQALFPPHHPQQQAKVGGRLPRQI